MLGVQIEIGPRETGGFAQSGDDRSLRRSLSHYVRTGYGGAGTMTRRMGGTTKTAGRLYGVLESGRAPDGTDLRDAVLATGNDINAILDARIHAHGMTEAEAMALMADRGYQEEGEAAGKWRRAQLTSAQVQALRRSVQVV